MENMDKAEKPSEFMEILSRFKNELNQLDENSGLILEKTCQLRDFREPTELDKDKEINRTGIIGELDECLSRLSDYNHRLNEIKLGLNRIIG